MKIEWNDYDHIDFYTKLNFVRSDGSYHHIARCLWRESIDRPTNIFQPQTYLLDNDVSSFCMFELSVPTDNLKFSVKYFKDFQEETSNKMFCLTCSREMELHSENNELLLLNRSINCVYCFLKAPGIQTN